MRPSLLRHRASRRPTASLLLLAVAASLAATGLVLVAGAGAGPGPGPGPGPGAASTRSGDRRDGDRRRGLQPTFAFPGAARRRTATAVGARRRKKSARGGRVDVDDDVPPTFSASAPSSAAATMGELERLKREERRLSSALSDVRDRKIAVLRSRPLSVGIVGFGRFGRFVAERLVAGGRRVVATSRSDHSAAAADAGVTFVPWDEMERFVCDEGLDVIVLAVSILSFEETVAAIVPHLRRGIELEGGRRQEDDENESESDMSTSAPLIVELCSVKEHPRRILLDALPPECDVLCTHPMFGPDSAKGSWNGQNFVYERTRVDGVLLEETGATENDNGVSGDKASFVDVQGVVHDLHEDSHAHMEGMDRMERFLSVFEEEGCHMVPLSCAHHDAYAANSQFVTHLVGRILGAQKGLEPTPIDTRGFRSVLKLVETTGSDSFDLFYGLYKFNRNSRRTIRNLREALEDVVEGLMRRDDEEFERKRIGDGGVVGVGVADGGWIDETTAIAAATSYEGEADPEAATVMTRGRDEEVDETEETIEEERERAVREGVLRDLENIVPTQDGSEEDARPRAEHPRSSDVPHVTVVSKSSAGAARGRPNPPPPPRRGSEERTRAAAKNPATRTTTTTTTTEQPIPTPSRPVPAFAKSAAADKDDAYAQRRRSPPADPRVRAPPEPSTTPDIAKPLSRFDGRKPRGFLSPPDPKNEESDDVVRSNVDDDKFGHNGSNFDEGSVRDVQSTGRTLGEKEKDSRTGSVAAERRAASPMMWGGEPLEYPPLGSISLKKDDERTGTTKKEWAPTGATGSISLKKDDEWAAKTKKEWAARTANEAAAKISYLEPLSRTENEPATEEPTATSESGFAIDEDVAFAIDEDVAFAAYDNSLSPSSPGPPTGEEDEDWDDARSMMTRIEKLEGELKQEQSRANAAEAGMSSAFLAGMREEQPPEYRGGAAEEQRPRVETPKKPRREKFKNAPPLKEILRQQKAAPKKKPVEMEEELLFARDGSGPWKKCSDSRKDYGGHWVNQVTGETKLPGQVDIPLGAWVSGKQQFRDTF